jgi:hypothetical protein
MSHQITIGSAFLDQNRVTDVCEMYMRLLKTVKLNRLMIVNV